MTKENGGGERDSSPHRRKLLDNDQASQGRHLMEVSYRRDELPGPLDIITARFLLNPQIPRKSSPSAPSGVEHCRQTEPLSALRRIVPPLPLAQITPPAILCTPRRDAFVPVIVTSFHCPW